MAVGVIIGAAFGKVVDSLVAAVIVSIVEKTIGGVDFGNCFLPLSGQTATMLAKAKKGGACLGLRKFRRGGHQLHRSRLHNLIDGKADESS